MNDPPLDDTVRTLMEGIWGDHRGRYGPFASQGSTGSLDARRAAEIPDQPGMR